MRKPTETRFRKQLKKLSRPQSGWLNVFPAIMGKADGTVLTGIAGVVWVRNILNGQTLAVHNNAVPATPLLQVEVGKRVDQPGLWQIKGTLEPFSTPATGGASGSVVGEHHTNHEFPSSDTVWVDRKQIKHLTVLVSDAANFIVKILGGIMLTANGITKISTQTVDLSSYVPTEGAVFVCIESDDDGAISVNVGTGFGAPAMATVDDIPSPAAGKYTRAYVLLYEGQTALSTNDIVVPMPPDFNPVAYSGGTHDHDSRYPRKYPGKTAAPTVNDDSGDGYAVDDIWIDETNNGAYIALDVTVGAAVWLEVGGGGASFNDAEGDPGDVNISVALDGTSIYAARRDHVHKYNLASNINAGGTDTPTGGDEFGWRQLASGVLKKTTWTNLLAAAKTYYDTIYAAVANGVTNGDSHDHSGGDGAQINHTTLSNIGTNTHAQIDTFISTTAPATYAPIAKGVTNGDSHNHVGGDGAALNYTDAIGTFLSNVTVPASTTYSSCPWKPTADITTNGVPWVEGGVLSNLSFRKGPSAQPASGTLVVTLYVNGSATALTVTVPAGASAAATTYEDNTNTVNVSATDRLEWRFQNNATAASAQLTAISMKMTKQTT